MTGVLPFRSIRQSLRAVLFLGMVPLVILNGLPAGGCICANGRFMLFCPGCRGQATRNVTEHTATTPACCARKCCAQPIAKAATHPCCQGHKSCCDRSTGRSGAAPGFRCPGCTPVLTMLAIPVVNVSSAVLDQHQDMAAFAAIADLPSIFAAVHHGRCVEIDTGPPPNDLVVTFQRLII